MKELLEYSFKNKLAHIPSALSMFDYVKVLFNNNIVVPVRDKIVIGKPFGAQTYYLIWKGLGYLSNIEQLSMGIKHNEIPFVDFSEETLGNALGVASGIAMTTDKRIWVNLSDASLQMGTVLESIQFIGHNQQKNIFVTVDYNQSQVTGHTNDIISIDPIINTCKEYGWKTIVVDGHDYTELLHSFKSLSFNRPTIVFCSTVKGYGYPSMTSNIKKWHYKKIESEQELHSLYNEKNTAHLPN